MKKVLHVIAGLDRGGAESYLMNSLRHINRKKYKFGVVTFLPPRDGKKFAHEDELEALGVKIYRIKDNRFRHPRKFEADIAKIVKEDGYDIVHSHIDFMSALSLTGAKKGGATKRIAHSHNTNNTKLQSKKMRLAAAVLRRKLNGVATVRLACGTEAGEFLYGKKQRFTVIHNGVDLEKFRFNGNTRRRMRQQCGFDENAVLLLDIARLEPQKNLERLVDIFGDYSRKHPEAYLLIIGDGSLKEDLEDKIASERLEGSVILMPPQNDIERFYTMCDVFLMPSLFEGVPTAGIEAQVSGMKCIFSDKVPQETKILDTTEFLPLDGDWLSAITCNKERNKAFRQPGMDGYDITKTVLKLEEVYDK